MLEGWLGLGVAGRRITVLDPQPSPAILTLCAERGVSLNPGREAPVDTLLVAVKPQMFDAAAPALAAWVGPATMVVSIMAGRTLADLRARFPAASAVVRAMPNLPAAVGRGVTGVVANETLPEAAAARVARWLGAVGRVEWLSRERDIDIVTAVSGSGPAYVFLLAEALGRAAELAGLPAELAARLGRATVEGAGELMFRSPEVSPADLRRNVTSPGGTTAAALEVLMGEDALQPLLDRAVAAAFRRAAELSG